LVKETIMTNYPEASATPLRSNSWLPAVAPVLLCALTVIAMQSAQAQIFTVLHTFTGTSDGFAPIGGVSLDTSGNLYGSATFGGDRGECNPTGCGVVFKLTHGGGGWVLQPLYSFQGGADGAYPESPVVRSADGSFYSTSTGGGSFGYGTVFRLQPPPSACKSALCPWTKTEIYSLMGSGGYGNAPTGALLLSAGNIYGVSVGGGSPGYDGTVYELTPDGGGWTESVLNGSLTSPAGGVIFDSSGNLYGTCATGGAHNDGFVYQLVRSGSAWTLNTLVSFAGGDGSRPWGGLVMDAAGNVFGTTSMAGPNGGGTVFELTPQDGGWIFTTLYSFSPQAGQPLGTLTIDSQGNLYGTTNAGFGSAFKLAPGLGGWTYSVLHSFTGGSDGANPSNAGVTLDSNGNIFGTAGGGGSQNCIDGCGVVFEISP
jgi:hypothetical protein